MHDLVVVSKRARSRLREVSDQAFSMSGYRLESLGSLVDLEVFLSVLARRAGRAGRAGRANPAPGTKWLPQGANEVVSLIPVLRAVGWRRVSILVAFETKLPLYFIWNVFFQKGMSISIEFGLFSSKVCSQNEGN